MHEGKLLAVISLIALAHTRVAVDSTMKPSVGANSAGASADSR